MKEVYSKGFSASVQRLEEDDILRFSHADLARIDKSADRYWFARLFYRHKIAALLFPKHFIEVVGAKISLENSTDEEYGYPAHSLALLSKDAQVDPNHAVFSYHMRLSRGEKVSTCECGPCGNHRRFHIENDLHIKAEIVSYETCRAGIITPYYDPSDYCLSPKGEIIFFELDGFERNAVGIYLQSIKDPNNAQTQAMKYLERFNELYELSRVDFIRSGRGGVIALN